MPYGTSLRWCRSTLSSSARSSRASAASSSMFSGPPSGTWRDAAAIQHVAVGAGQRLARQQPLDALEDRVGAGGELQLQQFLARRRAAPRAAPARPPAAPAAPTRRPGRRSICAMYSGLMPNGSRVSVTVRCARSWMAIAYMPRRCCGVVGAVAQPQMQRRLAVAVGGEADARHVRAQLAVIVDLAVADQRRRAGEQRLVAGDQVDDRQPVVHQRDAADDGVAGAVRAAVVQAVDQLRQRGGVGRRRAARQDQPGNAAHLGTDLQQQVSPGRPTERARSGGSRAWANAACPRPCRNGASYARPSHGLRQCGRRRRAAPADRSAVADRFGDSALGRADDRAGLRHGFGDDAGQALGVAVGRDHAGHQQRPGGGHAGLHLARRQPAGQFHAGRFAREGFQHRAQAGRRRRRPPACASPAAAAGVWRRPARRCPSWRRSGQRTGGGAARRGAAGGWRESPRRSAAQRSSPPAHRARRAVSATAAETQTKRRVAAITAGQRRASSVRRAVLRLG